MRNQYAGTCYRCGKRVEPGDGHFEKVRAGEPGWPQTKWRTQHADCAIKHRGTNVGKDEPMEPRDG